MVVTLSTRYQELITLFNDSRKASVPKGSGTVKSAAARTGGGRPRKNLSLGAPGQLLTPTAAANWMLENVIPL